MFRAQPILFAFAAALGVSRHSHAEPTTGPHPFTAALEYVVPPGCPSVGDFKAIVTGRLGFDPFGSEARNHVLVSIAAGEDALEGRLEWRDEHGKWAGDQTFPLRKNDCSELTRTMGFALAVQINLLTTEQSPEAVNERTSDDASNATAPEKRTAATAPEKTAAATAPVASRRAEGDELSAAPHSDEPGSSARWAFAFGAGGSLGLGLLPQATALGRMFASVAWGHASLELGAELSTKAGQDRADGAGFAGRAWLATAAASGTWGPFSVGLLAKAGAMNVEGRRIDVPASPSGKVILAGVRLGLRQRLGRVLFVAERIEGLANLTRSTVTLDRVPVWTAPPVAGTVGFDVGAIFE